MGHEFSWCTLFCPYLILKVILEVISASLKKVIFVAVGLYLFLSLLSCKYQ